MNLLLAHHLEPHHVPVLLILFAAGCFVGWELVGRLRKRLPTATQRTGPELPEKQG
jgi:hypothetical protein